MAQSSPSGLTHDYPVLGSQLPVKKLLHNDCKWHKPA
ncbi:MAG: hypothetical protein ACI9LX_003853 [Paraglaciecola sp.]|jgi:hypothetical protein